MSEIDHNDSDEWASADELYEARTADKVGAEDAPDDADSSDDQEDDDDIPLDLDTPSGSSQHRIIEYVPDDDRQTSDFLTLYERTQLEIITANRIADTGVVMTDCSGLDEALAMARREIAMRKSPYVLMRCVGEWKDPETGITHRRVERWRINEIS